MSLDIELLKWLRSQHDTRIGMVLHYFPDHARKVFPHTQLAGRHQIMETVWSIARGGLVYFDVCQGSGTNWDIVLTDLGKQVAEAGELNPYDTESYLKTLRARAPEISDTVLRYAHEALVTFRSECHLASAVMLGVASEAAFLEMAAAFAKWLPETQGKKLVDVLASTRRDYFDKFREFRSRFETYRPQMPSGMADSLTLDAIADLLRIYRNDSGHPSGKTVSREDAFSNLRLFMSYMERLYKLKAFFESGRCVPPTT